MNIIPKVTLKAMSILNINGIIGNNIKQMDIGIIEILILYHKFNKLLNLGNNKQNKTFVIINGIGITNLAYLFLIFFCIYNNYLIFDV